MASRSHAVHFLNTVIRPALHHIALWNPSSEELLLGTALVESRRLHRRQFGGGPARGLFQMEPDTHDDIWKNYLKFRPQLAKVVASLLTVDSADKHAELEKNDRYAAAMAKIHYVRRHAVLPAVGDVKGMAYCWKRHYNTRYGRGKEEDYIRVWNQVMGDQ